MRRRAVSPVDGGTFRLPLGRPPVADHSTYIENKAKVDLTRYEVSTQQQQDSARTLITPGGATYATPT